ncbi:MAG: acylneuraminate cytidylyltransferase family protein [Desulfobacula sp.]|jgi:N-acylneuraminate cytidylyltransferase
MGQQKLRIFGFIFARGGSKGVKKKNIRSLSGKPLIQYAVEEALKSRYIERIMVSTDNDEIRQTALAAGAEIPFTRPSGLATDTSPEWLSWQHAVRTLKETGDEFDIFVSIPATSPLRIAADIDACIQALAEDETADGVITVTKAARHPSFNMVVMDDKGFAAIAMPDKGPVSRRQDASRMYDMTTVAYAARPEFILRASSLFEGRIKAVEIPRERALDIDTEFDFLVAELIINHRSAKE